jgi:hypothetical protein
VPPTDGELVATETTTVRFESLRFSYVTVLVEPDVVPVVGRQDVAAQLSSTRTTGVNAGVDVPVAPIVARCPAGIVSA